MADLLEDLQAGCGDGLGEQLAVAHVEQAVLAAVDDQGRHVERADAVGGVEGPDRPQLHQAHLNGDRAVQADGPEALPVGWIGAVALRQADLVAVGHGPLAIARQHRLADGLEDLGRGHDRTLPAEGGAAQRERAHQLGARQGKLLGDHPAQRDAQDVGAVDLQGAEHARRVAGQLGDAEVLIRLLRVPRSAVVAGDHVEVAGQRLQERLAPVLGVHAHAHEEQQRLTAAPSGNVVLTSQAAPAQLARRLEQQIAEGLGLDVDVVVRTRDELAAVMEGDPFGEVAGDPKRYQVSFLSAELDPQVASELQAAQIAPERVVVAGREIYAWHPEGIQRSPLARLLTDRRLGVTATARNWSTVTKLLALADE